MASKIRLRGLQPKDALGMLEWMTDPKITQFFRFDASKVTEESCLAFISGAALQENCRHWAIADETDTYLGTISLKEIDRSSSEYAISTRSCAHGTGAAMEATRQVLRIAFEELGLNRVYLNVLAENGRANAFYRKAGFCFTHTEKDAVAIRGEMKDLNWYEYTAPVGV